MSSYDFDHFGGKDIAYPAKPSRPATPDRMAPATEFADYAVKLAAYEADMVVFNEKLKAYREVMSSREYEFKAKLAEDYGLHPAEVDVLYGKAYEDGHHAGLHEVYSHFDEYYALVNSYADVSARK